MGRFHAAFRVGNRGHWHYPEDDATNRTGRMLIFLTRSMRLKAAVFLAFTYAFAVLAPHTTMAIAGAGTLAHCLKQDGSHHNHVSSDSGVHVHDAGATHSQGNDGPSSGADESKGPSTACCGLFASSAVVTDLRVSLPLPVAASQMLPFPVAGVDGQGPGRIIRPPIT